LTVAATALDKIYDGSTLASVVFSDNRVTGDALTLAGVGAFAGAVLGERGRGRGLDESLKIGEAAFWGR